MYYKAGTELRLEPGGLRWHNVAAVGYVDKLVHGHGIKGESHLHLTAVYPPLEFLQSTDTAYEVDSFVASEVNDAEYVTKDEVG